jgi:hypothetical protein
MASPVRTVGKDRTDSANGTTTTVLSVLGTTTTGDSITVHCSTRSTSNNATGVTDSKGNTYVRIGSSFVSTTATEVLDEFFCANPASLVAGTDTITVTYSGTSNAREAIAVEWPGTFSVPTGSAIATGDQVSSTAPTAVDVTPSASTAIVVGHIGYKSDTAPTVASPFTLWDSEAHTSGSGNNGSVCYRQESSTTADGPAWTTPNAATAQFVFTLVPSGATNATVTPSAVAATTSVGAPTVVVASGATVTPSAIAASTSVPNPTVVTGLSFVRVAGDVAYNNTTGGSFNLSPSVTDGDLLLFAVSATKGSQTTWTDPAGVTAELDVSSGSSSSDSRTRTFLRSASSDGGATYTFTPSIACSRVMACLEYAGVNGTTPINALGTPGHDTTSLTGVTTTVDGALIVVILTLQGTATITTPPTGTGLTFTLRETKATTFGSGDVTLYVYDAVKTHAGATGTISWSGTPTNSTYQVLALAPAVAPYSTTVTPSTVAATTTVPFGQINQGVAPSTVAAATTVPNVTIVASGSQTNISTVQGWYTATTGSAASGTATVTLPTTPIQGNVLVIAANADQPVTTPSGWTLADSLVNVSGLYVFTKTAGASESTSVAVTFAGVGAIAVAELSTTSGTLDAASGQVTRTSGSAPVSVSMTGTTSQSDEYIVAVMGSISAAQLQWDGWTSGFAEQADTSTTYSGTNVSIAVADYALQGVADYTTSASTYDRSTGLIAGSPAQALLVGFKAVAGSATARPQTVHAASTVPGATISVPINATVTPAAIAATTVVPIAVPNTPGSTVVPAQTIAATSRVPSIASTIASSAVSPDTITATSTVIPPAAVAGTSVTTVTPSPIAATTSVPAVTLSVSSAVDATVPARTIASTATVPAVGVTAGVSATVMPNAYAAIGVVLTPSGSATSVSVAPAAIRAATAVSSGSANITIPTYMFIPPTVLDVPQVAVGVNSPMNRLAYHMNAGARGQSVWVLKDGTYTLQQPVYWEDVARVYYGGHQYTVSAAEAQNLVNAGFTVTEATS